MSTKTHKQLQFGVLPCRVVGAGRVQVMLLTSRETGRWIIPKGWPMKGKTPRQVAAQEAFEEAGLVGNIAGGRRLGSFHYEKTVQDRSFLCEVKVYLFWADQQLTDWPEKDQRQTQWFDLREADNLVSEGGLAEIMRRMMPVS
jgi:8-oxo-dGTP pyrophosphatase MutT (NUDIX family)